MYVVATAGHVDHGKSTLVRALTGIEPDRWDEEKRRGLTIDLGFAWTTTPFGRDVAFVDVPGHERFLGNMLAGIGPAPVVCFVVSADEGWRPQSSDHRDAIEALGIEHGVIVITRTDLAPDRVDLVTAEVREELSATGLRNAPIVPVSARTGAGLDALLTTLDEVLAGVPKPLETGRIRFWIDRAFTIRGAGTVVTGTLAAGSLSVGDKLTLVGTHERAVSIRGLQEHGSSVDSVTPARRVAVNLRGADAGGIHRGDALVSRDAWQHTAILDVCRVSGRGFDELPEHVSVHVGTLAVPGRLRPFGDNTARLTLERSAPLSIGDRIVLQDNGSRRILSGIQVVDVDPPKLGRRGDGARRAAELATLNPGGDSAHEVWRRGAIRRTQLERFGLRLPSNPPKTVLGYGDWWIDKDQLRAWVEQLNAAIDADRGRNPLSAGLSRGAAMDSLELPDIDLLDVIADAADVQQVDGFLRHPAERPDLGDAASAVAEIESRLRTSPFAAPDADELTELGLGARELAAAERLGRVLRLADGIVLLPTAPALAMRELARLPGSFTTSEARAALATTRRVAIPLLEYLDSRGWTKRIDPGHRIVVRARG